MRSKFRCLGCSMYWLQHDRLMHIKRQLRNDAVPSADADDYIQTA
jgi:hypothetical protein